jgi:hypothetical protein
MLETNPHKRLTIDDVIKNKWIAVSSQNIFFNLIYIPIDQRPVLISPPQG